MNKEIAFAMQINNIRIPPTGRPYWTTHNSRGNAGPDLTDEELDANGLSIYKSRKRSLRGYEEIERKNNVY